MYLLKKILFKKYSSLLLVLLAMAQTGHAQINGLPPKVSSISNPLVLTMVIIMLILLLAIGLLAHVLLGAAQFYHQRDKETAKQPDGTAARILSLLLLVLCTAPLMAQDAQPLAEAVQPASHFGGLSATAFYFMTGVIAIELLVLFFLLYQLQLFLAKEKVRKAAAGKAAVTIKTRHRLWEKFNSLKPLEQEAQLDLGHDYDGIRELDNRLPPWWLYGFYLTIVVGVVYLWRYHVSETAPLPAEEYHIAMQEAAEQKTAWLKKSANNVDENTVKLLTETTALSAGQVTFQQNCAACHGKEGQGMVGPNLTDDYWLHGGSIKDVFKTIKYGYAEKGMRSWKEDLSPAQIAQVASYIKSLRGTYPPNPKEKQGDLYQESNTATTDTTTHAVSAAMISNSQ